MNFRHPLLRLPIALRVGHVRRIASGFLFAAACCVAPPHACAEDANEIVRAINMGSVLADAFGALRQLAQVSRIDIGRVAIMGFSFGGRTALWAAYPSFQERYGEHAPRFAAHLGVYPAACYVELADEAHIGDVPIRIFHGTADDWTPVEPCRGYVARLRRAGKDAALFEYAAAGHRFENDTLPSHQALPNALNARNCMFVERAGSIVDTGGRLAGVDSPCYTRGTSIGYSADARRQAVADVHAFLGARFGSP